jgi:hypothetical protein
MVKCKMVIVKVLLIPEARTPRALGIFKKKKKSAAPALGACLAQGFTQTTATIAVKRASAEKKNPKGTRCLRFCGIDNTLSSFSTGYQT